MRYAYVPESVAGEAEYRARQERAELPPPARVTSRDMIPTDVVTPAPVTSLAAEGFSAGWMVKIQYSRGYAVKYRGQWQEEELWAVRFARGSRGAFAVYRSIAGRNTWTWRDVWMWGDDLLPFGQAIVTELREWLEWAGRMHEVWYQEIVARRVEQERLKKLRDPLRVEVRKAVDSFPALCAGLSWPAVLMFAADCAHETWDRADGIYTPEELSKILSTKRELSTKGAAAS
jgi:hypothetical protein